MTDKKLDLRNPIFHSDDAAREHLEQLLWPHGPVCPRCGVMGDRVTKLQGKSTRPGVYKCKDCRKPFSVTVGTVMERSHIPLSKWVLAAQLMASSKKGMSALQLQRMIGTNYETAWFLFHRLREAAVDTPAGPIGGANKVVEADESYLGGKAKNKAFGPPPKKMAVFSLVERDGYVRSRHVADVTAKTLREAIVTQADRKSYLMTDEATVYEKLGREFSGHGTVNHSADEYVRTGGFHHTNTVESFFALLKRGVYGNFHHVSEAHLHRYLAEADFKYNHRKASDAERGEELLKGAKGKRLLYRQPDQATNA
ncbi:MAG TPA: IS1595 family transposase [Alphaproteobacteria bacterium]|nr:IS1595 family transposase [Alphaproteobacteria bacterium]